MKKRSGFWGTPQQVFANGSNAEICKKRDVYPHAHCLPSASRSWQVMRSGYLRALLARMVSSGGVGTHRICLLFCKEIPVVPRRISQVYLHLLCLLFSVSHVSKRHFSNGNRRKPPPCLPKSETDGRCQWRRSRSS